LGVFANVLGQAKEIKGIQKKKENIKLLFSDDMIACVENLKEMTKNLELRSNYYTVARLRLIYKSQLLFCISVVNKCSLK